MTIRYGPICVPPFWLKEKRRRFYCFYGISFAILLCSTVFLGYCYKWLIYEPTTHTVVTKSCLVQYQLVADIIHDRYGTIYKPILVCDCGYGPNSTQVFLDVNTRFRRTKDILTWIRRYPVGTTIDAYFYTDATSYGGLCATGRDLSTFALMSLFIVVLDIVIIFIAYFIFLMLCEDPFREEDGLNERHYLLGSRM